jgi:hypothetical protein
MLRLLVDRSLWLLLVIAVDLVSATHWSDAPLLVAQRWLHQSQSVFYRQLRIARAFSTDLHMALSGLEYRSSASRRRIRKRQVTNKCALYLIAEPTNTTPVDVDLPYVTDDNHDSGSKRTSSTTRRESTTRSTTTRSTTRASSTTEPPPPPPTPTPRSPWNLTVQYVSSADIYPRIF